MNLIIHSTSVTKNNKISWKILKYKINKKNKKKRININNNVMKIYFCKLLLMQNVVISLISKISKIKIYKSNNFLVIKMMF